ncbi:MAG: molybdopterin molybdenumtransferase MoeA [Rhodobacteraceae bacterium]|nr:molybdopterin molybdenumtransferase MoeA [Paracoccaceae bacterium]
MVDWSGGNDTGPRPRKDAIWACIARGGDVQEPVYLRNRAMAREWLHELIEKELAQGRRLALGFDFPFGYPKGVARALTGSDDPLALWAWVAGRITDAPKQNNRFDLAGEINSRFDGSGPFWANGLTRDIAHLPRTKAGYANPFPEQRVVETHAPGSFTVWQLAGAGAVGSQVLMGLPVLQALRQSFPGQIAVWPFEPLTQPVAFLEIWPTLHAGQAPDGMIKDAWQVQEVARQLANMPADQMRHLLDVDAPEEGWIFSVDPVQDALAPPPLKNDCFSLPPGVDWTPVDEALDLLRSRLTPVTTQDTVPLAQARGRVLARDVVALRSNPPQANSAVDGYGFAGGLEAGPHEMPLIPGRSAAGVPFDGGVPKGSALRILTGAAVPEGVETVILEEDVTTDGTRIAMNGPLKRGANTRRAGEDVMAGDIALRAGRVLDPGDLALAAAVGQGDLPVRARLRVAVLSTGDELVEPGGQAGPGQIFDANRPMLLALVEQMGAVPIDMGRVSDDRAVLRARMDAAAEKADLILTSGGASAGDEDHVSALLREAGALQHWRIAIKPGRPLALALWQGVPVFGLPGNPVAALTCALVFAAPAMRVLAGAEWRAPQGMMLPAGFEKRKKPGRREFLRARLRDGMVEIFRSEGSGLTSGLSWAEGLVELPDSAMEITRGDLVRYIPMTGFFGP